MAFARILLHGVLKKIHNSPWYGTVTIRSFVDDIRHTGRGCVQEVLRQMRDTAVLLADGLRGIKCKISTKSVCLSNRQQFKKSIVEILRGQGVAVQAVSSAPDLGFFLLSHAALSALGFVPPYLVRIPPV